MTTHASSQAETNAARRWAAGLLIGVPVLFMTFFTLLQMNFDYPDVLRKPATEILTGFTEQQALLLPLWFGLFASSLLFIPLAILVAAQLKRGRTASLVVGVLAGLVQAIGLARWVFLVPLLARLYANPEASPATKDAVVVVFESLHQFLGVGVGEHLGFLFTGVWTLIVSAQLKTSRPLLAGVGVLCATGVLLGLLEPLGTFGWVSPVNAAAYTAWSIWLVVLGVLVGRNRLCGAPTSP